MQWIAEHTKGVSVCFRKRLQLVMGEGILHVVVKTVVKPAHLYKKSHAKH
jgi:hypothetical protein